MKKTLLAVSTLCSSMMVYAQEQADTLDGVRYNIAPLVKSVQEYKNKQQLVLDETALKYSNATTVDQLLRSVAGVDIRQRGPAGVQSDIAIDGGTFDQVMMLVNGLKIADPQTGHNMMMLPFEIQNLQQVQVIKGAASSMYGVNALTGVVNIVTRETDRNYLDVTVSGGSSLKRNEQEQLYYNSGIVLQGGLKTGKFSHNFNAGWKYGNGYRPNTAYNSPNAWYDTKGRIGKHHLHLMGGYRYMDFGANGFYAAPGDSNSHETVQNTILGLKHLVPLHKQLVWTNDVIYNYKTDDYKYIKEPVLGHNKHFQNIVNLTSALQYKSRIGNLKLGLELRNEQLHSSNLGTHQRFNTGVLFNYDVLLARKWSVEAGVYANQHSSYGFQLYPNLGIGYFLSSHSKLIANISSGQRLPTFTDLYYQQRGVIEGNADLKPEQAVNTEIGYQAKWQEMQLNTYVFYRSIDRFIDWTKADVSDVWRPANYHQLNTWGYHVSLSRNRQWTNKVAAGYRLGYNYLHPDLKEQEGSVISRYAVNALRHHLILSVHTTLWNALKLQAGASYQSRISYKDYWLLDASIVYTRSAWEVGYNVQNLGNVTVTEAGANPLPGTWMQLFLKYAIR